MTSRPIGESAAISVEVRDFGRTKSGAPAHAYVLRNDAGVEAVVTDFGATLVSLLVPDRAGNVADIVLGFDDVTGYEGDGNQYFGCTAGRVANRVARGKFTLDGADYALAINNPPNSLHGGDQGFGQRLWTATPLPGIASVRFDYFSPNGQEGYPGNLDSSVTYTLTSDSELVIEYSAHTDAATPMNLTHHSYFNLAGAGHPSVLDHVLQINAGRYTPTDETLIPTGEVVTVADTPLDFRVPMRIGARIASLDGTAALGYDHNYAVRDAALRPNLADIIAAGPVARLSDPSSGRVLEVYSDQPGLQFYTGNFLFGQWGKGGAAYPHRSACCLETQGYPNAINEPGFPTTVLRPGQTYKQITVHRLLLD
ncbi:MAG: aldose epimerase family protein [Planctomycetota bacterium]